MKSRSLKSPRVLRCLKELKNLSHPSNKFKVKKILKACPNHVIDAICEVSLNVLKNKVKIKEPSFSKLKKYKKLLRDISQRKRSNKDRRQFLINQRGGSIVPLLLSAALPIITKLLS